MIDKLATNKFARQEGVTLKPKRDKPVIQHHPWIFSGAIQRIPPEAIDGDIVDVTNHKGQWLCRGLLNRSSQIQVRILSWDQTEVIDNHFWRKRLAQAINLRHQYTLNNSAYAEKSTTNSAIRLVHAESDYLPGLTVDQYGDYLAFQIGSLGIEMRKAEIADLLIELTGCKGIIDRSDGKQRRKERIPPVTEQLIAGEPPPDLITIEENALKFQVDLINGQKTGFYLDQRENRQRVAAYCRAKNVLNAFSYTGAFSVHALAAGANSVTNVDTSNRALSQAEDDLRLNGFDPLVQSESITGDVFEIFRAWRDAIKEQETPSPDFDVIILDPPKFAHSAGQLDRALRGYKDINMLAMQISKPNGVLATFSCSGLVSADLFQKVIFGAAVDAGRDVQILETLHQPADHPTAITVPEGAYLKGFICRVV